MSLGEAFDAMLYAFSPTWGARRIVARKQYDAVLTNIEKFSSKALESAETNRLREGRWLGSRLSADAVLEGDLTDTRHRSRELYRNDFVGGAIDSRVEHVVGTGFTVQARVKEATGIITAAEAEQLNKQLEAVFERVEPTACRTRKKSLWQKICLACRCVDADGEAFVVFSDAGDLAAPIPLCVEVVDADRVETPPRLMSDPLCRLGVQYNKGRQITGYWVRKSHPDDDKEFSLEYDFIPAWRVQHIYVEWFAGQSRGLPWMTRALNRAKDGKDLTEAGIIGAQVEACFAAFIKSKANPINKAIGATTSYESTRRIQDVRPGGLHYLNSDEEITFATPSKANAVGTLQEYNNRTIAASLNWPYEMLMKDWRGVSFAGGRIILNAAKISVKVRQKLIIESMLRPFWNRLVDEAVIVGAVDIDARLYRDNAWLFQRHTWTAPKWSYAINPSEEVKATILELDNNLTTLANELGERQLDLEEVYAQRQIEREMARQYGITPNAVTEAEATAEQAENDAAEPEMETPEMEMEEVANADD